MASPISAGEIYAVAQFAYNLLQSCQKARGEFDQIANEVSAMRAVVQMAHLECKNPVSILNATDTKDKTNRKALTIHLRRCNKALQDVEACLQRYIKMTAIDKFAWSLRGRDEIKGLESNLSSYATQLDSFFDQLTVKGVGAVYQGIGRIEEALERLGGNDGAAVKEVMQGIDQSKMTPQCTEQYKSIISDYAREVSQSTGFAAPRAQTPDSRGRKTSNLSVPATQNQNRSKSAEPAKGAKNLDVKRSSVPNSRAVAKNKPKYTLECWLIQVKSGNLSPFFVTWEYSEKLVQSRGQFKLEEMARQFKASKKSKLNDDHNLVNWVLKDRRRKEDDSRFTWYPYAAKKEEKGSLPLNLGVEEQAMVIIRRALTAEAQKRENETQKAAQAKREAARKKVEKEATDQKAEVAAADKVKSEKEKQRKASADTDKRKDQIRNLKAENATLKTERQKAEKKLKAQEEAAKRKEQINKLEEGRSRPKTQKQKAENKLKVKACEVKESENNATKEAKNDTAKKAKDDAAKGGKVNSQGLEPGIPGEALMVSLPPR